jgi:hypothetical protein
MTIIRSHAHAAATDMAEQQAAGAPKRPREPADEAMEIEETQRAAAAPSSDAAASADVDAASKRPRAQDAGRGDGAVLARDQRSGLRVSFQHSGCG